MKRLIFSSTVMVILGGAGWMTVRQIRQFGSEPPIDEFVGKQVQNRMMESFPTIGWTSIDLGKFRSRYLQEAVTYDGTASVKVARFGVPYRESETTTRFIEFCPRRAMVIGFRGTAFMADNPHSGGLAPYKIISAWTNPPLAPVPVSSDAPFEKAWQTAPQEGDWALCTALLHTSNSDKKSSYDRELVSQVVALRILLQQGRTKDALMLLPDKMESLRPSEKWEGRRWDLVQELKTALYETRFVEINDDAYLQRYLKRGGKDAADPPPDTTGINLRNH